MNSTVGRRKPTTVSLATAFSDQSEKEDLELSNLTDEELEKLHAETVEAFDQKYAEMKPEESSEEHISELGELAATIETLSAEIVSRETAKVERAEKAAELAEKVEGYRVSEDETEDEEVREEKVEEDEGGEEVVEEVEEEEQSATTTKLADKKPVAMRTIKRKAPEAPAPLSMREHAFDASGKGATWKDLGKDLSRQLDGFNASQYRAAARSGEVMQHRQALATFSRQIPENLIIRSNDESHVDEVLNRAVDESRLPQGGLIASGGWCAPSETLYDLLELETVDGLFSLPEVGLRRGGIRFTKGASYQDIYSAITGFAFTEDEAKDGKYKPGVGGNEVGPKPSYHIDCPDFEEVRLDVEGMFITAGLLEQRGYPEYIARILRGAVVARTHRTNAMLIDAVVEGSTDVDFNLGGGATTSILNAIELQVNHYRAIHRLGLNQALEAVFPFWVRGVIRADLANRQGVDLISVSDASIISWFRNIGVAPQFTYNWQDLAANSAASTIHWPGEVSFLLYLAGTWVRGSQEIISVENMYDSTLLEQNNYTALFVEDGWAAIKRGFDSRHITVPVPVDGAVGKAVELELDGDRVVDEG